MQCLEEVRADLTKTVGFKIKETNRSNEDSQHEVEKLKEKRKVAHNLIEQLAMPRQDLHELASDSLEVRLTNEQISEASS